MNIFRFYSMDWCCRPRAPTSPASEGWKGRFGSAGSAAAAAAATAGEGAFAIEVGGGGGTEVGIEDMEAV